MKTKKNTIKSLALHGKDVGSMEVQIGLLSDKKLKNYLVTLKNLKKTNTLL